MAHRKIIIESDEVWTQRDGVEVSVGDMTENHVRNTLRMILCQQRQCKEFVDKSSLCDDHPVGNGGW